MELLTLCRLYVIKSLFSILCRGQKLADFCQFLRFLRRIAGATQLKKGEKWLKMSRF